MALWLAAVSQDMDCMGQGRADKFVLAAMAAVQGAAAQKLSVAAAVYTVEP